MIFARIITRSAKKWSGCRSPFQFSFSISRSTRFVHTTSNVVDPVRVRFAPSPTGKLHLGGLRTALYNYLLARKTGGTFILRIEDTDRTRLVDGSVQHIKDMLSWAGMSYDEGPDKGGGYGPYIQSERSELYKTHATQLLESGHAYRCFCSSTRLEQLRQIAAKSGKSFIYDRHCLSLTQTQIRQKLDANEPHVLRLKAPDSLPSVHDIAFGQVSLTLPQDVILMKSSGLPTYHLANVIDDHYMKITHVLRGEEWLSSLPIHVSLYQAFGWDMPSWCHLPILVDENGKKLSKRGGNSLTGLVDELKLMGYEPEAIINFVALLGWSPPIGSTQELFTMDELISSFSLSRLHTSPAKVMLPKLNFLNKHHLHQKFSPESTHHEEIIHKVLQLYHAQPWWTEVDANLKTHSYMHAVIDSVKTRVTMLNQVPSITTYFFLEPNYLSIDAKKMRKKIKEDEFEAITEKAINQFVVLQKRTLDPSPEEINNIIKNIAKSVSKTSTPLMQPVLNTLRYALTGQTIGAGVVETVRILGLKKTIDRIYRSRESMDIGN
ncbi:hypothetical protein BKA69DRAFT_1024899 [Paraphysoderma sedebokerense]|nr:hypothetical protein BKA69DRAFT_1024899 [Paraphysoderma sedebokerense]